MAAAPSSVARYYDWLARFQTVVTRLGHRGGFDSLTVHRLLSPDRPGVGPADVVHDRLIAALGSLAAPRAIDAGCGVGGTIFYLQGRLGGQYDGLTMSAVQQARAIREAERRGVADNCRFHVRSYDQPLPDLAPGGVDLIVAIESLAHSARPAGSIANLARALRPGGRLAIVDDVPGDALDPEDADFAGFKSGWSCPAIASDRLLVGAWQAAGLVVEHEEDLTSRVPMRDREELERLVRRNRRWRRLLGSTSAAALVDSLYGGLMLERLYRRGLVRYRFVLLRRETG
jgi:SAM-dependent methyltransferase